MGLYTLIHGYIPDLIQLSGWTAEEGIGQWQSWLHFIFLFKYYITRGLWAPLKGPIMVLNFLV